MDARGKVDVDLEHVRVPGKTRRNVTTIDNTGESVLDPDGTPATADADLVLRTRSGDKDAFGELWFRHYRSGTTVARAVSSTIDPDDLVQEAYARIYQSILRGGGPTGSFRAYLFTSIRNTAAAWGRSAHEHTIDLAETIEDPSTSNEAAEAALDRSLTHRAFRSLPTRWQEVLWYTEIEDMKPAEIAPLLGMRATAVAQLAYRAREGLREAWIQAHLQSAEEGSDCQWTIERLGAHARETVSRRDLRKIEEHLAGCARCTIVAAEAKAVSSRLALVLLPLTLGAVGAAGYLASLQGGGVPAVALAAGAGAATPAAFAPAALAPGAAVNASGAGLTGGTAAGGSAVGGTAAGGTAVGGSTAAAGSLVAAGSTAAGSTATVASGAAVAAGVAATAAAAGGGVFSGLGVITGVAATAAVLVGSSVTASLATPDTSRLADGSSDVVAVADAPSDDPTAAVLGADGTARDEIGDGSISLLPAGVPSLASASVSIDGTQPTFSLSVSGQPGTVVEVLLNGAVKSVAVLDDGGTGGASFQPNYGNLVSDALVQLRYRAGELVGESLTVRLSELADLGPLLLAMKPLEPTAPPVDEADDHGNGPTTNSGNGPTANNGNGPATTSGNGPATNNGNGPTTNSGKAHGKGSSGTGSTGTDSTGTDSTGTDSTGTATTGTATTSGETGTEDTATTDVSTDDTTVSSTTSGSKAPNGSGKAATTTGTDAVADSGVAPDDEE
ncbi:sigma-70 family RNA polymerase sigma factor [Microbacterium sp. NPDC019599]|uniref:sigma-70 family RNA polymerase sigma factor n=1 Tax=Microbacterium sp. NPDC019599 TaxID=3154690 RepID=UPI003407C29C